MKIRELIDLGFHVNFVPIEESGSNPYFYVGCDIGDMYIISKEVEMEFEENGRKHFKKYLDSDVEVSMFDYELPLSEEVVKALINQKL